MKMKKSTIIIVTIAVLAILAGIGYWRWTGRAVAPQANYDNFAKCLTEKGVAMYGAYWCSHCQNQKKMFGDSWQYVNYVECNPEGKNANPQLCIQNNIQGYPTWIVNGKIYTGEKTIQELSSLSECQLS